MKDFRYTIKDQQGIHARPAGVLVKVAAAFPCDIKIAKGAKSVDLKRILGVMSLGVKCGEEIIITAEGDQEAEAIEAVKKCLEENL